MSTKVVRTRSMDPVKYPLPNDEQIFLA